jgi:hypothetical protein
MKSASTSRSIAIDLAVAVFAIITLLAAVATPLTAQEQERKVRARVQAHPGGPIEDVEMSVHEVPVDPKTVSTDEANLEDDELVLGLVIEGQPIAYPIRYLAMFEVINDRVGDTPLAPTW